MADKTLLVKIKSYFTAASSRSNLVSGEELPTSLGKIAKFLGDLKPVAFSGSYNDLTDKPSGDISTHIATNVEDEGGVHGIRCYNGKLEVYNAYTGEWCDPSVIGVITGNVSGIAVYARYHFLEVKWSDPSSSLWDGTKVVMKEGSYPENENDGLLIIDSKVKNAYSTTPLFLYDLDPSVTYYFQFFPYTNRGAVNRNTTNRASGKPLASKSATYGLYNLNGNSSGGGYINPAYTEANSNFTPAHLNTDGSWDWGSWKGAWFIPRPCMLRYDGTVDYYLDPDDYTKKEDGTASDVANLNYEGNAMMEWPAMYYSITRDSNYGLLSRFSISDTSGTYHRSKFYTSIYNCTGTDKLRSISGVKTTTSSYVAGSKANNIERAHANNVSNSAMWHMELFGDRMIIAMLLVLLTKNVNTQNVFGLGMVNTTSSVRDNYVTGALNDKGLFYGSKTDGTVPVKIFGMENYWGHSTRMVDGFSRQSSYRRINFNVPDANGNLPTTSPLYYNGSGEGTKDRVCTSSDYIYTYSNYGVLCPDFNPYASSHTASTGLGDFYGTDYSTAEYYGIMGGSYSESTSAGAFYINTATIGYPSLSCRRL